MVHIAICDDEQYISDKISAMVSDFFRRKNMEIAITQFSNGEELLKYGEIIDILFLDIQMNGIDGMETARKLRNRKFKGFLIFITVLKEMVFQAFDVQAYDYLVKPVEARHLEKTMERLLESMQNASEASLLVQKGCESSIIAFEDIVFCEIIDRKVYLNLVSSEVIDFYERIEKTDDAERLKAEQEKETPKVQNDEKSSDKIPVPHDEYISSEKSGVKPNGLYRLGQDEDGKKKVFFDCTGSTDKVDREIKKLKEKKKQLEQQIQSVTGDEKKVRELEEKLEQVESELSQKDNDTYRRQHSTFSE